MSTYILEELLAILVDAAQEIDKAQDQVCHAKLLYALRRNQLKLLEQALESLQQLEADQL